MTGVSFVFLATLLAAPHSGPSALPTETPVWLQYFGSACSEALGRWLPQYVNPYDAWRNKRAKRTAFVDRFMYKPRKEPPGPWLGIAGIPEDGTPFVYGTAGPPKGYAVYDYRRHIVFYQQGCCSWSDSVAAAGISPPPKRVVNRDLSQLHTEHGIRLGQTVAQVRAVYGFADLLPAGDASQRYLAYFVPTGRNCGQYQNFVFKNNRLRAIVLSDAC